MSDPDAKRTCPRCAEEIKAAAKVCPFCQTRQSRFMILGEEVAIFLSVLFVIGLAVPVLLWAFPHEDGSGGRAYSPHRGGLQVVRTQWETVGKRADVWLSGYVTNQGNYPWRVRELEVRYLDAQGGLLEVDSGSFSDPFVVQPGYEHAFRLQLTSHRPYLTNAANRQVRVQSATDGNLKPKNSQSD